jgi:putative IMPACT (imprinted ancient) family translation regulator
LGLDINNYRLSDDGEPSGTAGKPILNQILSKQITNVTIIVVRYFGGTLLGVSGLINAYKTAAALTLQIVPIVQKTIETNFLLEFDYTIMNNVMLLIKQFNCSVLEQQIQLFCVLKISVANAKVPEFLYRLKDFKAIQIQQMN